MDLWLEVHGLVARSAWTCDSKCMDLWLEVLEPIVCSAESGAGKCGENGKMIDLSITKQMYLSLLCCCEPERKRV